MNTTLSDVRPADEQDRLDTLTLLTRDTRVSHLDRFSLRTGLWLLLRAERRTLAHLQRASRAVRAVERDEYVRHDRDEQLTRAAVTLWFR